MDRSSSLRSKAEPAASAARFRDPQLSLHDLSAFFLVECPRCQACARVEPGADGRYRLSCGACGHGEFAIEPRPSALLGGPFDAYFQQPLWLATPCCGECLWAYNEPHLDLLEAYVAAKLRERSRVVQPATAQRNKTLVSRLPTWLKLARNRAAVLAAIAQLRARLPTPTT